jgi:hypothetical protein
MTLFPKSSILKEKWGSSYKMLGHQNRITLEYYMGKRFCVSSTIEENIVSTNRTPSSYHLHQIDDRQYKRMIDHLKRHFFIAACRSRRSFGNHTLKVNGLHTALLKKIRHANIWLGFGSRLPTSYRCGGPEFISAQQTILVVLWTLWRLCWNITPHPDFSV